MTEPTQLNPLSEAKIDSIDELMSRDPLGLSTQDLEKLVATLRERRKSWLVEEAQGKKRATKAPKVKAPSLSIEDLDL